MLQTSVDVVKSLKPRLYYLKDIFEGQGASSHFGWQDNLEMYGTMKLSPTNDVSCHDRNNSYEM